jgi:hypothetical protein
VAYSTITKICETCGVPFQIKKWQHKRRFCSISCAHKGKSFTEEHRRKIGEANQQPHPWTTEYNLKHKKYPKGEDHPMFGQTHTDEARKNMSKGRLAYIQRTPIELRRRPESFCKLISEIRKRDWQNPEFVRKVIEGQNRKPTRPERQLIEILNKHFPQFEYNGDFSLGITLGGLIPDFVNTNGKKEVIEVLGDYFHSPEVIGDDWRRSELGKLMIYNSLGYKCLSIWEHDLKEKTEGEIVNMVKAFTGGGKCQR